MLIPDVDFITLNKSEVSSTVVQASGYIGLKIDLSVYQRPGMNE